MSVSLAEAGSNIRMRAHNVLDPGRHQFPEKLRGEEWRNAKEFEAAVGLLLFFFGFHVDPLYAQRRLGNAVDHLAHGPGFFHHPGYRVYGGATRRGRKTEQADRSVRGHTEQTS